MDDLEAAIIDLMDGNSEHDIQQSTGLSEERCLEIKNLFKLVHQNYSTKHNIQTNPTIEITEIAKLPKKEAQHVLSEHYANNLTYKNMEFFDKIYMGIIVRKAQELLNINDNNSQECYLGYIPNTDTFVSGWDTWQEDNGTSYYCIAMIKVDNNGYPTGHILKPYKGMFYSDDHYDTIRKQFPTLIDIRLD
jgi:hypothetical protein